jgi:hypothetical protein
MRMLSLRDLRAKGINYTPQWLCVLIKNGRFPAPCKMGMGSTGRNFWPDDVIDAHLAAIASGADQKTEAA